MERERDREKREQEREEQDERFRLEQLVLRLGRKRVLATLNETHPSDYEAVRDKTLLTLISSVALLARLLSPLWKECGKLAVVCRRFGEATRHPEFWMPAVRQHLRRVFPRANPELLNYVNPFFRFPEHMPLCPPLPYNAFLDWLFNKTLGSHVESKTVSGFQYVLIQRRNYQVMRFALCNDGSSLETTWYTLPVNAFTGGTALRLSKTNALDENSRERTGYVVQMDGISTWCDGPVGAEDLIWCGYVKASARCNPRSINDNFDTKVLLPWLGRGEYK